MEEIFKATWLDFRHDGAAVFFFREKSSHCPLLLLVYSLSGKSQIPKISGIHWLNNVFINCEDICELSSTSNRDRE